MKNIKIAIILTILPFSLFASELDTTLRHMLEKENLVPIEFERDLTSSKFQLGEKLFNDNTLSGNKNISCKTCHDPNMGTSDNLPLPIGEGGTGAGRSRTVGTADIIPRNSPHLFNLGFSGKEVMFWDGRVTFNPKSGIFTTPEKGLNGKTPEHPEYCRPLTSALSAQAMFPPLSHSEMRGQPGTNEIADAKTNFAAWEKLTSRITAKDEYKKLIKKSLPDVKLEMVNFGHLAEAMGHFQANKFAVNKTPFDIYLKGNNFALTDNAKKGAILFYSKARCFMCHTGINLTDSKFHNVAFPQVGPGKEENRDDKGLYLVSNKEEDLYKFRTPGLRNVALTAPYGHSGSLKNLTKVVEHYRHPMRSNHHYDGGFRNLPYELPVEWELMNTRLRAIDPQLGRMGVPINPEEVQHIVTFLREGLTQID